MENKQPQKDASYEKYMIIFALVLFAGIIIFNAVNSPLIGGSNIVYVNNPAASVAVDEYSAQTSQPQSVPPSSYDYLSSIDETAVSTLVSDEHTVSSGNADDNSHPAPAPSDEKININTASQTRLQDIPGIGSVLSGRIVEYRELNGGFKSVDELINVSGIGEATLAKIRNYVTV